MEDQCSQTSDEIIFQDHQNVSLEPFPLILLHLYSFLAQVLLLACIVLPLKTADEVVVTEFWKCQPGDSSTLDSLAQSGNIHWAQLSYIFQATTDEWTSKLIHIPPHSDARSRHSEHLLLMLIMLNIRRQQMKEIPKICPHLAKVELQGKLLESYSFANQPLRFASLISCLIARSLKISSLPPPTTIILKSLLVCSTAPPTPLPF